MAEAFAPEVVPFSSEEIETNNLVWRQKSTDKEVGFQPAPGGEQNRIFGPKITGAFQPGSTERRSPVKERNYRSKPVKRYVHLKLFFLLTFPNIGTYMY